MANVFTRSNDATPKPNRNVFDGSFVNNLTLKAGDIVPCFCKEVLPGDSFRINPTFGFNFQPFVFPVQTDMQASIHFFYVRNRTLWRGWENFITKTENPDNDTVPPYIYLNEGNRDMFDTGKIGDYLGVPTVYYSTPKIETGEIYNSLSSEQQGQSVTNVFATSLVKDLEIPLAAAFGKQSDTDHMRNIVDIASVLGHDSEQFTESFVDSTPYSLMMLPLNCTVVSIPSSVFMSAVYRTLYYSNVLQATSASNLPLRGYVFIANDLGEVLSAANFYGRVDSLDDAITVNSAVYSSLTKSFNTIYSESQSQEYLTFNITESEYYKVNKRYSLFIIPAFVGSSTTSDFKMLSTSVDTYVDGGLGYENKDRPLSELPFVSYANPDGLRISAMPFRAVDACYNSFYRDDRNNPLILDGKPYYNIWSLSREGGADTRHYQLYKRNWEQDVFTTAVQSPQQGIAPLVGVTSTGRMTFQDEEGNTYTLQATVGEDGHTLTGISSYSSDMPVGTLRAMVDMISSGISINDFRNVNALQRWLETNMRKGLRYKDQIEAHFGTSPTYSDLQMPEFIGGVSRRVSVNKVVQTTDTGDTPLGTLAGNATVLGEGQSISHYCDEHGWIIGFVSIVPKPVYSQQLNKQLLKSELLDYYFPEFAHIGYQPILNQELAPLQCKDEEGKRLADVFGYQRAWYEYLANVDEVHGNFRNSLRNYIINRVFSDVPQLSTDFLLVSDKEVNEVFAVQTDDDKIFGQIYFDVKMKRPIPKLGIPKLEVG